MMTNRPYRNLAFILGILGGVFWLSLAFFPPRCAPITEASEVFCNRLWTPALVLMLIGFTGWFGLLGHSHYRIAHYSLITLTVGLALMVIGNGSEYWIFHRLPHQGPDGLIRSVAWMTTLFGLLLVLVAGMVLGLSMLRSSLMPRLLSIAFILLLPLTIAFAFVSTKLVGVPLGSLSILSGLVGVFYREKSGSLDELIVE